MTLAAYLTAQQDRIQQALERLVPSEAESPSVIHCAMRYSLFAGGKRVRPVLALAAAEAVGGDAPGLDEAACALEMIHTYSLIHDDLPALDNDDLRRGRPTSHKMFGEAMAILAGDALLTVAFLTLARMPAAPERKIAVITEIATASGTVGGMIGGQVLDLEGEHKAPSAELLDQIHRAKTGALLLASVRTGALCAGATAAQYDSLSQYGRHIGLAFQIVDDILDVEQPSEKLGKTAGKDAAQHKITFPAVYGLDQSRAMAERERNSALAALEPFGGKAQRLREVADLIVHRGA